MVTFPFLPYASIKHFPGNRAFLGSTRVRLR
jgi:hypothetical protein